MIHWAIIVFVTVGGFMLYKAIKDDHSNRYYEDPTPVLWLIGFVAWMALWGGIWLW